MCARIHIQSGLNLKKLTSSSPHSEASVEYLLRVTKLPTADMLFNKWKEGTGTKTNKQQSS